jgi:hypothetical protein
MAAQMITGKPPSLPLELFSLGRVAVWRPEPVASLRRGFGPAGGGHLVRCASCGCRTSIIAGMISQDPHKPLPGCCRPVDAVAALSDLSEQLLAERQ